MITESLEITCNGKTIATEVMIPETERERVRGMYKTKAVPGKVMMFMNITPMPQLHDMLWMREKLGYIALDINSTVLEVGVMKPWFTFKIIKCLNFIEGHPSMIKGIKKGDKVTWHEKDIDKQKTSTTSKKAQGKTTSHPAMQ